MEGRRRWESDRPVPTHLFAPGGARCFSQRTPSRSRRTHTPHTRHARLGGRAGGHPSDGPGDGPGDFGRKRERKKCDACSAVDASNLHSPAPRPAPSAPLNRRAGPRRIRPGLSHTRTRTRSHTHKNTPSYCPPSQGSTLPIPVTSLPCGLSWSDVFARFPQLSIKQAVMAAHPQVRREKERQRAGRRGERGAVNWGPLSQPPSFLSFRSLALSFCPSRAPHICLSLRSRAWGDAHKAAGTHPPQSHENLTLPPPPPQ